MFWNFIKNIGDGKKDIPETVLNTDGAKISEKEQVQEVWKQYFSSLLNVN